MIHKLCLGNRCTSRVTAKICRLLSVIISGRLLLSVLYINTVDESVKIVQNEFLRSIGEEQKS